MTHTQEQQRAVAIEKKAEQLVKQAVLNAVEFIADGETVNLNTWAELGHCMSQSRADVTTNTVSAQGECGVTYTARFETWQEAIEAQDALRKIENKIACSRETWRINDYHRGLWGDR